MSATLVICGCCKEPVDIDRTGWDADLRAQVCRECEFNLAVAGNVMRHEFDSSGCKGEFPPLHRGPFHGSSCG